MERKAGVNIGGNSRFIDKLKNLKIDRQIIGSDRRTIEVPLRLTDITFVDSKENLVVQIADIIAGAANYYYRSIATQSTTDSFYKLLKETRVIKLPVFPLWPELSVTPELLNTKSDGNLNLTDSMTKVLFGNKDRSL